MYRLGFVKQVKNATIIACAVLALSVTHIGQSESKSRKAPPTAAELSAMGLIEKTLQVNGTKRWFLVQPPRDPSKASAILLVLHGGTQSMRRLFADNAGATRGWPDLARRENALLLAPNAINSETGDAGSDDQNWNDLREGVNRDSNANDVGFITSLLDWAEQNYNVDQSRIYVTGASNGGMMTFRLLIDAPERFTAGAAFVASLPVESSKLKLPTKPTPLMIANGTLDPLVQWEGGKIAGGRGEMRSVNDTIQWWLNANKAEAIPSETPTLRDLDPDDNCTIQTQTYTAKPSGAPIVTYSMIGGGHSIPSAQYDIPDSWLIRRFIGPVCSDAEGIELIWSFLSAYKR